jgi:malonyl CoA-acyl carrier protein transacylase
MYDTMDKDGNIKILPPLCRHRRSDTPVYIQPPKWTFLCYSVRADLRAKGLVQNDCTFGGHSPVEYSALAHFADVLPTSALVDIVFYCRITMQRAVVRDSENRSNYAMCTVNPSRIFEDLQGGRFTRSGRWYWLFEIVNYNTEACDHHFIITDG